MKDSTFNQAAAQARPKASDATFGHPALNHEVGPWHFLSELSRQQLAAATESASAIFRSNETMRKIQQDTAHEASLRHAKAAKKLLAPCQPADVLSIQSELLCTDMQSAGHYWERLASAIMQAQREMMASVTHLFDSELDAGMKSTLQAMQVAMPVMMMANNFLTPKKFA